MTDQEINEAIARRLGWTCDAKFQDWANKDDDLGPIPNYCQSIEAAWEIVEKMRKTGDVDVYIWDLGATVTIYQDDKTDVELAMETADTAPRAICLAFLKLGNPPIQPSECEWLDHEPRKAQ